MDGMYCHQGAETKGEESSGVIQMIDNLVNDVEKENQMMKLEDEDESDAEGTLADTDEQMAPLLEVTELVATLN